MRPVRWALGALVICALGFVLFRSPDTSESARDSASGGNADRLKRTGNSHDPLVSIFEEEWFKRDQPSSRETIKRTRPQASSDLLDPADALNPINPITRLRYTNSDMRRFDRLRQRFPGNSAIPERQTSAVLARKKRQRERLRITKGKVAGGQATEAEVREYYALRSREVRDRAKLLDYFVTNYADSMTPERLKNARTVLGMQRALIKNYEANRRRESARQVQH